MTLRSGAGHRDREALSADDVDVGNSDFVASGDDFGSVAFGGQNESASHSGNGYTPKLLSANVRWDKFLPTDATVRVFLSGLANDNGDQIDARLRNRTDGETIAEGTNLGTNSNNFTTFTIESTYTPTTTGSRIVLELQIRNSDNSTSVTIREPTATFAVEV